MISLFEQQRRFNQPPVEPSIGFPEGSQQITEPPVEQEPSEFPPLKKYYLIQRLNELKSYSIKNNITNEDLDTILKFSDSLSYNTLLSLSKSIIQSTGKEVNQNAKKV